MAGGVTDEIEAKALLFNNQHIDIYSASWGPHDQGATMEGPQPACKAALRKGVETVSLTGSRMAKYNSILSKPCNANPYVDHIYIYNNNFNVDNLKALTSMNM